MKKARFTDTQVVGILNEAEAKKATPTDAHGSQSTAQLTGVVLRVFCDTVYSIL